MDRAEIFHFYMARQFFHRHRDHLEAAKKIGAEALKISAADTAQLPSRFFSPKSDLEIPSSEPPVLRKQQPGAQAEEFSDSPEESHRQNARDGRPRAVQKIDAEIEHAEAASRGR
jgi:hypothetical protein